MKQAGQALGNYGRQFSPTPDSVERNNGLTMWGSRFQPTPQQPGQVGMGQPGAFNPIQQIMQSFFAPQPQAMPPHPKFAGPDYALPGSGIPGAVAPPGLPPGAITPPGAPPGALPGGAPPRTVADIIAEKEAEEAAKAPAPSAPVNRWTSMNQRGPGFARQFRR